MADRRIGIRPAAAGDAGRVYQLITANLVAGHLLARPLGEVELHVPRFLVATDGDDVVGCGELARLSPAPQPDAVAGAALTRDGVAG